MVHRDVGPSEGAEAGRVEPAPTIERRSMVLGGRRLSYLTTDGMLPLEAPGRVDAEIVRFIERVSAAEAPAPEVPVRAEGIAAPARPGFGARARAILRRWCALR